jgi:hypothetical protein
MLDNMLSNQDGMESVGELRLLQDHVNKTYSGGLAWNWTCTCREAMQDCKVWGRVAELLEADGTTSFSEVNTRTDVNCRTKGFHRSMLLALLLPFRGVRRRFWGKAYKTEQLRTLGESCYRVLSGFSKVVGADTVIDSSKTVEQLHALIAAKPDDVTLKVVHVVRDGRAVLYSKIKRAEEYSKKADEYRGYGASFSLISTIRGWCYINFQIAISKCFFERRDFMTVRYEDLCRDREATLKRICERLEIPFGEAMLFLSSEDKHNIGGSSHRFTWNAETPIRTDERWKEGMERWPKLAYYLFAGVPHKWFGY